MARTDIEELKANWVGRDFDSTEFTVSQDKMLAWARACGETDPRFTDPEHPDFQAHPGFVTHYNPTRVFPDRFPRIGSGRGFDGGKSVEVHAPVRPGDMLTATSQIADIYEKTGRSGTMVFIVHRMTFTNPQDEPVAVVDWRMIQQDT